MPKRSKNYKFNETRTYRKRKLKYKNIIAFFLITSVIVLIVLLLLKLRITNIYITGNTYLTDQEIIDMAGISNYPEIYKANVFSIKKKLVSNQLISNVKVTTKMFTSIYIDIVENRPLFYDCNKELTILSDGSEVTKQYQIPKVINYVPDTIYQQFLKNMLNVDIEVLERISEIKYDPNDVDDERFLLYMSDNNYVYLTLNKFNNINDYLDIIKKFGSKKGILYLDSGEYFKVLKDD